MTESKESRTKAKNHERDEVYEQSYQLDQCYQCYGALDQCYEVYHERELGNMSYSTC